MPRRKSFFLSIFAPQLKDYNMKVRKLFLFVSAMFMVCSVEAKDVIVEMQNNVSMIRENEIVEIPLERISATLGLKAGDRISVMDAFHKEVPTQITYDRKLIFPANVGAGTRAVYTIRLASGVPAPEQAVFVSQYTKHQGDVVWENDKMAYRLYGPNNSRIGLSEWGNDVWLKRVPELVVDARMSNVLSDDNRNKVRTLSAIDGLVGEQYAASFDLEHDHGNGMDCYSVGASLGCAGTALVDNAGRILFSGYYKSFKILDNGPLRLTFQVVMNPVTVNGSVVTETRTIQLDRNSQFNKTTISYTGLGKAASVITGLVMHKDNTTRYGIAADKSYMTYEDLTCNPQNNNGKIFVAAMFPQTPMKIEPQMLAVAESQGGVGHVAAFSTINGSAAYTYYWGAGWTKFGFPTLEVWNNFVRDFAAKVKKPIVITLK